MRSPRSQCSDTTRWQHVSLVCKARLFVLALCASLWSNTAALPNPGAWKTRGDDGGAGKRKREDDVEEVWGRVMGADSEIETFRDATIDKWNAKVMLGSGARNATKFKALNQSILTQVCVFGVRGCL